MCLLLGFFFLNIELNVLLFQKIYFIFDSKLYLYSIFFFLVFGSGKLIENFDKRKECWNSWTVHHLAIFRNSFRPHVPLFRIFRVKINFKTFSQTIVENWFSEIVDKSSYINENALIILIHGKWSELWKVFSLRRETVRVGGISVIVNGFMRKWVWVTCNMAIAIIWNY